MLDDAGEHSHMCCPVYLDVFVPPGRRKTLPVETTRHAFAYVFAGGGKFTNASGPQAVRTEGVGSLDTTAPSMDSPRKPQPYLMTNSARSR